MVVKPKVRGFICTTAHPVGCFENVKQQVAYVKDKLRRRDDWRHFRQRRGGFPHRNGGLVQYGRV